jgi:steroid delta-isomerase-like uncharacterized protein
MSGRHIEASIDEALHPRLSRRGIMRGGVALGLSTAAISGVLAGTGRASGAATPAVYLQERQVNTLQAWPGREEAMMVETTVVQQLADAVQRGDAGALAELYAEDAVLHHPLSPTPVEGRQAIQESEQVLFDAFSEIEVELRTVLTADQSAAAEVVLRATNSGPLDLGGEEPVAATGRRIELPAVWVLDLGPDGLIVAERDYFDTAAFISQLGL